MFNCLRYPIHTKIAKIAALLFCLVLTSSLLAQDVNKADSDGLELARYKEEYSTVRLEPAKLEGQKGIAVIFEGTEDLHYYARAETTPAAGYELKVKAQSTVFKFGRTVLPQWEIFKDPTGIDVEVYAGDFMVFVPIEEVKSRTESGKAEVTVTVSGMACTSQICLRPFEQTLQTQINYNDEASFRDITLEQTDAKAGTSKTEVRLSYSLWYALGLAFVAGLCLNIMPCVWPILPLVVMRIVEQAKNQKAKKITMGISFCFGIILFFVCLAVANIFLKLTVGTALQWGDQFRNPVFVTVMALVLVVLALFMFDVFSISVPASVSGKTSSGSGYTGTAGMGFLAAILSTPCSFGILAAAFAWAQGQPLVPATAAILCIGLGMAVPYLILTAIPGLLEKLPRPGRWMDIFKKFVGFVLLTVAVWMITVVPQDRRAGVLYFAVVLAFCVWMWGGWVGYSSKLRNKIAVRSLAVAIAVVSGASLLTPKEQIIDWQKYEAQRIEDAKEQGRPVLIKFTADWCLSCKAVEQLVYSHKDVAELIEKKGVLPVKADTTVSDYPATRDLAEVYNEPGVPVSILIKPVGGDIRWHGKSFADELIEQLKKLPQGTTDDQKEKTGQDK